MLRLLLIRHGQTAWNREQVFRGRADIPLSELGARQAQALSQRLAEEPLDALYCSPLSRARQTAEAIGAPHHTCPQLIEDLTDFDYGEWTGRPRAEVAARWPELLAQWQQAPHGTRIPGAETLEEAQARAVRALEGIVVPHEEGVVAIVSHRVITKLLVCHLVGLGRKAFWRFRQDTCGMNAFGFAAGRVIVLALNDTGHLHGLETDAADF